MAAAPAESLTSRQPTRRRGFHRLAGLLLTLAALGAQAETLTVGGTGAALGTMQALGEAYSQQHPEVKIKVLSYIGSGGAIKGVDAGSIDLGLSGRAAKPAEEKLNARLHQYAVTPLVIATHQANPLRSITRQQLAAIYRGEWTHWQDGGLIRIVLRPAQETDNDTLRTMSPEISAALDSALARPGMRSAPTDQDGADMIEKTPGAIGTTTLSLVISEKRQLHVLALDGVSPDLNTLKNGRYAFAKPLFLVTRQPATPLVQSFVAFIQSPRGQAILSSNGQLPLAR